MGLAQSAESGYFLQTLHVLLKEKGSKLSKRELENFFETIQDLCPWFPKEGSVNLEHWRKVGQEIKNQAFARGAAAFPPRTFVIWASIRDILDPSHSVVLLSHKPDLECSLPPTEGEGDNDPIPEDDLISLGSSQDDPSSLTPTAPPYESLPKLTSGGDEFPEDDDVYLDSGPGLSHGGPPLLYLLYTFSFLPKNLLNLVVSILLVIIDLCISTKVMKGIDP